MADNSTSAFPPLPERVEDCPNCRNGLIRSAEFIVANSVIVARIQCDTCGLKGPFAPDLASARYWWNLLARLQIVHDRMYVWGPANGNEPPPYTVRRLDGDEPPPSLNPSEPKRGQD